MRPKIDTRTVKFRVAGVARPRQVSRNDPSQKLTPASDGGRPVWSVRLIAIDTQAGTTEQIFVDVAGEMPELIVDEIATVDNLFYVPWAAVDFVGGQPKGKLMRAYRADAVALDTSARRAA